MPKPKNLDFSEFVFETDATHHKLIHDGMVYQSLPISLIESADTAHAILCRIANNARIGAQVGYDTGFEEGVAHAQRMFRLMLGVETPTMEERAYDQTRMFGRVK